MLSSFPAEFATMLVIKSLASHAQVSNTLVIYFSISYYLCDNYIDSYNTVFQPSVKVKTWFADLHCTDFSICTRHQIPTISAKHYSPFWFREHALKNNMSIALGLKCRICSNLICHHI